MENKTKSILALVLTAVLVVMGGFLPKLSALALNRTGGTAYEDLQPMEVELSPKGGSLSNVGKLSLMRNRGSLMQASEGKMQSDADEIWKALKKGLEKYFDAGLFPQMTKYTSRELVPGLIFDSRGSGLYDLFWLAQVNLSNGRDQLTLTCLLDDDSGRIYSIYFTTYNDEGLVDPGRGKLAEFCDVYFDGLGLTPKLMAEDKNFRSYLIRDEDYGHITFEITSYTDEFQNNFHIDIF